MVAFWNGAAGDLSEIKKGTIRVLDNVRTRVSAAGILQGIISHGGVSKAWRPTISTFDASHRELVDGLLAFVPLSVRGCLFHLLTFLLSSTQSPSCLLVVAGSSRRSRRIGFRQRFRSNLRWRRTFFQRNRCVSYLPHRRPWAEIVAFTDLGVRCDHLADPISTIAQVLADTSDDAVHHIKARIVGYAAVESWIRAICPECYEP